MQQKYQLGFQDQVPYVTVKASPSAKAHTF